MTHCIENGICPKDLPADSELKAVEGLLSELSMMTLKNGNSLIFKNNSEIFVPMSDLVSPHDVSLSVQFF